MMAFENEPRNQLLSLPSELRMRVLHTYLAGWEIPINGWTQTINETLPLIHLGYGLDTLKVFHVNRQTRAEAQSLIAACATLCFLPGPRSAWDKRWRTAGTPLPDVIRENVQHVKFNVESLSEQYANLLRELPQLRHVRLESSAGRIDRWNSSWSRNWHRYVTLPKGREDAFFLANVQPDFDWLRWMGGLLKEGGWSSKAVLEYVVLFPNIVGEETRTGKLIYTVDADTYEKTGDRFEEVRDLWPEDNQGAWTMPIKDLWRLGDNSKLDDVVTRTGGHGVADRP